MYFVGNILCIRMSLVKMICNFGGISCTWIHFEPINMGLLKINH